MPDIIGSLVSLISGGNLTVVLVGVLAFIGWGFRQRVVGARIERDKQAADRIKARSEADKIDDAIAGRDAATNRKELGTWGK